MRVLRTLLVVVLSAATSGASACAAFTADAERSPDDGGAPVADATSADGFVEARDGGPDADAAAPPCKPCKPNRPYSVGVFEPAIGRVIIAPPASSTFDFTSGGTASRLLIAGHWTQSGANDTLGTYDENAPGGGPLFKLFATHPPSGTALEFRVGSGGDLPVAGDWNGDGKTNIGLYRPSATTFLLWRTADPAVTQIADLEVRLDSAVPANLPVTGDWDCDGVDGIGVYVVLADTMGRFDLRNSLTTGPAEKSFIVRHAAAKVRPIAGDWDGDGRVTVGLYMVETGTYVVSNVLADADLTTNAATPVATVPLDARPFAGRF